MELIKRNINNGVVVGMNKKIKIFFKDNANLKLKNIEIR